ncbi:MAG: methyltransferase domain-containing protein [Anaerolineales bacterium]|nr:methyltransferase domain-containing protein [Anaerolineales bacterium]
MLTELPRTYYVQTMPGVEQIAWLEIRRRLPRVRFVETLFAKDQNGIVVFEFGGDPADLLQLRTTEDAFVMAASLDDLSRDWRDLRAVTGLVAESPVFEQARRLVRPEGGALTYRVISRKFGQHQYRRMDLGQAVVKGVERRYGRAWRLVEDDADLEVWANALGSRLLCGLRLSTSTMRHRDYRVVNLPASLRPSVAAAMVLLTEPEPTDVFLDPMCGSGTLLAERVLAADYAQAFGGDLQAERTQASQRNLVGLGRPVTVFTWDACRLPLATGSVDKVSVNPPFGKQLGSPLEVAELYPCFFGELARVLRPGGRATVLSSEFELVKDVLRRERSLQILTGYSIAVLGQWGRIYIIRRN